MATVSAELRLGLTEDVTKKTPGVAAAIEKMQKEASALQAALAGTGASDRLTARLAKLRASASQVNEVTQAWREFASAQKLAANAKDWTAAQSANVKRWEDTTIAAFRAVSKAEAERDNVSRAVAKKARDDEAKAEARRLADQREANDKLLRDTVQAAQKAADEKKRIQREADRDAEREAKRTAAEQRKIQRDAEREARKEASAQRRAMEKEQQDAQRHAERLAHEQARTDNTVAGVTALYAAHQAKHAADHVLDLYGEFDKERRYGKVVMGINDAQQKPLVDQAINGSANSKFNDIEWLKAQRSLAARGYNRDQVLGFTPTADVLATDFDVSMEQGVKLLEGAMLGFGKDVSTKEKAEASVKRTADVEVKASKISGMNDEDIVQLYKAASSARQAGLREEQLLAFGGALKKRNMNGDEAATAFRALSKNLLHPTSEARTALAAAGINFGKYQKIGAVNEDGFASEVARVYGVKLKSSVRAGLHRIFTDRDILNDPARFEPAVTRLLRRDLHGNDAKSLKSIAGLAGRYRDASAETVDTQGLLTAIIAALAKNPALGVALWGSKQGGRISAGLDDTFLHLLEQLDKHAEGFGEEVKAARMEGFAGARGRLFNQLDILTTRIGSAFDGDGRAGLLTGATDAAGRFVHALAEANPRILRAGSEAVLLAGAFAALKGVDFLRGGLGIGKAAGALDLSAGALDTSAKLLDEAAIKLGAARGGNLPSGQSPAAEGGKSAPEWKAPKIEPAEAPKGLLRGGLKSIPKKVMLGGPQAIAEYLAYQAATGVVEQGFDLARDHGLAPKGPAGYDPHVMSDRGVIATAEALWAHLHGRDTAEEAAAKKAATAPAMPATAPKPPLASDDDDSEAMELPGIDGARAAGGPVSAGRTYLVGERGPELFTAGATGQVTNSQALLAAVRDRSVATPDVQRILARASFASRVDGDTAKAVRALGFELASSVDRLAQAVDRVAMKAASDNVDVGSDGGGAGGGHAGGRRGFMSRMGAGEGGRPFNGNPGVGHWWTKDRISHAIDRLMGEAHLSRAGAEGLVSRWATVEAAGGPTAVNPKSGAWGIGQWLGSRGGGRTTDFDGQLAKAIGELNGPEKRAAQQLRAAQDARTAAIGASMFERAEHYNAHTGVDDWTAKSEAGNARLKGILNGTEQPGDVAGAGPGISSSKAVDSARAMIGMNDSAAGQALHHYMHSGAWCADFVNGTLAKIGGRGTNNALAASFFNWGKGVADPTKAKAGDVMVAGHHVGFAEGPAQMHNGRMMVPMISGNHGHRVGESWEPVGKYQIRCGEEEAPALASKDDPLGLRASRKVGQVQANHDLHGKTITPAVDGKHLDATIAKLEHIHRLMKGVNDTSARHRSGGGGTQIAGLGARTRGNFSSSGPAIG